MHLLSLRRGLLAGLIYGLILAPASLALATLLLQRSMATAPPVITDFTLGLLLWTVGVSALAGALVGGLGGAWLERRPTWYIHLLPPFFLVPLALVELPTLRPLLLLLPLGLAHGGSLLLWRWLAPRCVGAPAIHRALGVVLLPLLALGGWWAVPVREPENRPRAEAAPSLLWVVFDTTRADRAARAEVAPTLARLRAEGSSFD
ncbi:MAG TPA: hypothetical protein PKY30_27305, partial [Myxococcota bacterium]|nr:hypothetical protein [Myxococcota bacterium]